VTSEALVVHNNLALRRAFIIMRQPRGGCHRCNAPHGVTRLGAGVRLGSWGGGIGSYSR